MYILLFYDLTDSSKTFILSLSLQKLNQTKKHKLDTTKDANIGTINSHEKKLN
jgi:hypothetical protein